MIELDGIALVQKVYQNVSFTQPNGLCCYSINPDFWFLIRRCYRILQTSDGVGDYETAATDDIIGDGSNSGDQGDRDFDGLPDAVESQYGTDPDNEDTDGDGMLDGWEVDNGLNPLDNGESDDVENDPSEADADDAEVQEEDDSWPNPDDGLLVTQIEMV